MPLASRLVAMRQHQKRRVVAVAFQQTLGLLIQPSIDQATVANDGSLVCPDATFDLQIHAHLIGHHKGGFRRAPGVETHMVEPMLTDNPKDSPPSLDIHRRVASERKIPRILRPTEEDRSLVEGKLSALHDKVPPPEGAGRFIASGKRHLQRVQDGAELIPSRNGSSHRNIYLNDILPRRDLARPSHTCPRHLQAQLVLLRAAGLIAERHQDAGTALTEARVDLHILDPNLASSLQLESADDAVPI